MTDVEVTIVGGGVVGLAIAAELAPRVRQLLLIERNNSVGMETSSRNSEVIHAGLYYTASSLKARLCVEGNRLMYEWCEKHGVQHKRLTKIITATNDAEFGALQTIHERAKHNGAPIVQLSAEQVHGLEPEIISVGGLLSTSTGIVSAHGLMDSFATSARNHGAIIQTRCALRSIERTQQEYRLSMDERGDRTSISSTWVVNAAGLESDTVAAMARIDVDAVGYRLHWSKGNYFSVPGKYRGMVNRLVYPVPGSHSLGIHVVLDLVGRLRFGPDVEFLSERKADYTVDASRRDAFAASVRRILPFIEDDDLTPDMAGIRPKLQDRNEGFRDFVITEESPRGLPKLINLIGIESPGLTASIAIARMVAGMILLPPHRNVK